MAVPSSPTFTETITGECTKPIDLEKILYFGRIGHDGFKNYDLIKDSPVYVNGTLMNGGT
jgi:hypothetical protein